MAKNNQLFKEITDDYVVTQDGVKVYFGMPDPQEILDLCNMNKFDDEDDEDEE